MSRKHNALVSHRKRWKLSQSEVGQLLALSEDAIAHYEKGERSPQIEAAIGLELVYGKPLTELFPDMSFSVASDVLSALADFSIQLEGVEGKAPARKRRFVRVLGARLANIPGI
jgi:transcriptional regulator with XRE-family HTH domain